MSLKKEEKRKDIFCLPRTYKGQYIWGQETGRKQEGEGTGNPLQYSCLENPLDGEAWWATVHGVTKE